MKSYNMFGNDCYHINKVEKFNSKVFGSRKRDVFFQLMSFILKKNNDQGAMRFSCAEL